MQKRAEVFQSRHLRSLWAACEYVYLRWRHIRIYQSEGRFGPSCAVTQFCMSKGKTRPSWIKVCNELKVPKYRFYVLKNIGFLLFNGLVWLLPYQPNFLSPLSAVSELRDTFVFSSGLIVSVEWMWLVWVSLKPISLWGQYSSCSPCFVVLKRADTKYFCLEIS